MRAEAIFWPAVVLALWTGTVMLLTGFRRVRAVVAGRTTASAFRLGESPDVPADVAIVNRNLVNLLEMPVLFYAVILALYVTRHVAPGALVLAWLYVALRLVHSGVHLTYNNVRHRLIPFALSNFVLVTLWIWFARRL